MENKIKLPLVYEDAKRIIVYLHNDVDMALDYGDAFVFARQKDSNSMNDYGWAIMKENAKIFPMGQYLFTRNTNASPKEIPF
jgi:hypothetical protein